MTNTVSCKGSGRRLARPFLSSWPRDNNSFSIQEMGDGVYGWAKCGRDGSPPTPYYKKMCVKKMMIPRQTDVLNVLITCRELERVEPGAAELLRGLNNLPV